MSGFPRKNVHWNVFYGRNMWNPNYYLRREKMAFYQLSTLFTTVCNSIGVALLTDYNDSQAGVEAIDPRIYVYNNDLIGSVAYNVWACVFVAIVFNPAFILDLIWPERIESPRARLTWKIGSVLACIFELSSALTLSVIVARHCGYITGDAVLGQELLDRFIKDGGTPLCYRTNPRAVVVVIFAWLGFVAVLASTVVLWLGIRHDERGLGPWIAKGRARKDLTEKDLEVIEDRAAGKTESTDPISHPAPVAESNVPAHTAS